MNMDALEQQIMKLKPIPVPERRRNVSDARHPLLTYSWDCSFVGEEILEFGVANGSSLQTIRRATLGLPFNADFPVPKADDPLIYGFDSWEGLPESWSVGEDDLRLKGRYKTNPPRQLEERRIRLVDGLFKDSIPKWLREQNPGNVRFMHIDCDIYSSTKEVLSLLNSRIIFGTVLVFDELMSLENGRYPFWKQGGEWIALKEWLEEHSRSVSPIGRTTHEQVSFLVTK